MDLILKPMRTTIFAALTVGAASFASCTDVTEGSVTAGSRLPVGVSRSTVTAVPTKHQAVQHVVVIVQENRSFDNLFQGYPGANTSSVGYNSNGDRIPLHPVPLETGYGIDHRSVSYFAACDGVGSMPGTDCKMDGFDKEVYEGQLPPPNPQYGYVPHSESHLYFELANRYVLADNMFASQIDASFTSHQYLIAGQAGAAVDFPVEQWGCGGDRKNSVTTLTPQRTYGSPESPCFGYLTLADELDAKGLPWRYYAADATDAGYVWSGYQAVKRIYKGPEWATNVISPPAQFLSDVAKGQLAAVTWITPTCADSDHSGCGGNTGPQWVASLVNAVGESAFWKTTTIFVMWDEWGGWYDHVPPPYADYDGLGFRVPLLVIGPYAKQGVVSHVQYEHGSILRYIEDTFGLGRLAASDRRANSPVPDAIDYAQRPRRFKPFATQLHTADFLRRPSDSRPPDDE